jgi:hypothetical protein
MTIIEAVTIAVEHPCEALTISDIRAYRSTASSPGDRRGRAVFAGHARALRTMPPHSMADQPAPRKGEKIPEIPQARDPRSQNGRDGTNLPAFP